MLFVGVGVGAVVVVAVVLVVVVAVVVVAVVVCSAPCDVAGGSNVVPHSAVISACVEGEQWQTDTEVSVRCGR